MPISEDIKRIERRIEAIRTGEDIILMELRRIHESKEKLMDLMSKEMEEKAELQITLIKLKEKLDD